MQGRSKRNPGYCSLEFLLRPYNKFVKFAKFAAKRHEEKPHISSCLSLLA
jgi:hypothetical protein